jgi:hypothetical protein
LNVRFWEVEGNLYLCGNQNRPRIELITSGWQQPSAGDGRFAQLSTFAKFREQLKADMTVLNQGRAPYIRRLLNLANYGQTSNFPK